MEGAEHMEVPQGCPDTQSAERASGQPLLGVAKHLLAQSGYRPLLRVRCECEDGSVVLSGTVPSYYHKQIAQAVLLASPEIDAVTNQIEVVYDRAGPLGGGIRG
jgi:hypothetical protein